MAVCKETISTDLKVNDTVLVLSGGNTKKNKVLKGQIGKILKLNKKTGRVIVEGLNKIKRHKRALTSQETSGIIEKDGSVHISNVMFYSEQLKRPVRIKHKKLEDGKKVRGYLDPKTKKFEQIDIK
jgi:large subunit ribosomal protein L24